MIGYTIHLYNKVKMSTHEHMGQICPNLFPPPEAPTLLHRYTSTFSP